MKKIFSARWKHYLYWLLLLLIGLSLIELSLRSVGFLFSAYQDRNLRVSAKLRILTLGESTSAVAYAPDHKPWPSLVKNLLEKQGLDAEVFNAARPGITSKHLFRSWLMNYEKFRPHIVISMMGINDGSLPSNLGSLRGFWLEMVSRFRLAKLVSVAISFSKRSMGASGWREIQERPKADRLGFENSSELLALLRKGNILRAEDMINRFLEKKDKRDRARFYAFIAIELKLAPGSTKERDAAERLANDFLKRALENSIDIDAVPGFIQGSMKLGRTENCEWLLQRQKESHWPQKSRVILAVYQKCLPANHSLLREAEAVMGVGGPSQASVSPRGQPFSVKTYHAFHEEFQRLGICWIMMTYPLRGTGGISNIYSNMKDSLTPVVLLKNDEPFIQALKKFPASDIFLDFFAGDFGHTTTFGHSLIAENVAREVVKLAESGKCGLEKK